MINEEEMSKAKSKLIVFEDIALRSPIWAALLVVFFLAVSYGIYAFTDKVIKPELEKKKELKEKLK